ncbi:solute carrier organic anion transporter family member 1C1-like [Melitaea cinxia]|uniref:solute carrier organic anion transporter family member 1C1-like n=1 Tax=Melitaea cinxia TaxID=113334 RepID=UPI001E26F337|nr:solute carrier organic anion transporter family member 1C1-like [Melitaea cinxia]
MEADMMRDAKGKWTRNRLASWVNGTIFVPKKLRGILMGIIFNSTIGEVCCYRLIKQDIKAGELPFYTADMMIVIFAIFEAVAAPLVSWWGFRKRQMLLTWYTVAAFICSLSWFFLPEKLARQESGVLLMARVFPFFLGHKTLTGLVESNIILQIVLIMIGYGMNFVQMPCAVPRNAPIVDGEQTILLSLNDRGFCKSIGRVFYNPVAMTLMFSMALTTTSLWGYGYYELDVIKVKFNLLPHTTIYEFFSEIGMCHFIAVVVAYGGVVFSAPVLMEFCKLKALKQAIIMSVLMFAVYIAMTAMPGCDTGNVAGMEKGTYGHPECSLSCNCKPQWNEYKPVCSVNDMVTYMSPCHAGCSESQEINGIRVYSNCTCAGGGHVLEHACGDAPCRSAHLLYNLLYFMLFTLAILAFQAQGVLLLRVVDPRDKSLAIGVACSIIAIMTFVVGQLSFYGLQGAALNRVERFKYLGHWVSDNLSDDEYLERERRALAVRFNMLARRHIANSSTPAAFGSGIRS